MKTMEQSVDWFGFTYILVRQSAKFLEKDVSDMVDLSVSETNAMDPKAIL